MPIKTRGELTEDIKQAGVREELLRRKLQDALEALRFANTLTQQIEEVKGLVDKTDRRMWTFLNDLDSTSGGFKGFLEALSSALKSRDDKEEARYNFLFASLAAINKKIDAIVVAGDVNNKFKKGESKCRSNCRRTTTKTRRSNLRRSRLSK